MTVPSVASPRSSPSGRSKTGLRRASASAVESRRGPSSTETTVSRPLASRTVTGAISASNRPASMAAIAFWWLASAKASWSSRLTWSLIATRSAWVPMWQSSIAHHRPSWTVASTSSRVAEAVAEPGAREQVRRAVHRLHAAGDRDLGVTGADLGRGQHDRLEPRAADPVDGRRRGRVGEAGLEHGLASRRLAGTGLEDLAHQHVVDDGGRRVEAGALDGGPDRDAPELGGRDAGQRAAELADRRARRADDVDVAVRAGVRLGHAPNLHRASAAPRRRRSAGGSGWCPRRSGRPSRRASGARRRSRASSRSPRTAGRRRWRRASRRPTRSTWRSTRPRRSARRGPWPPPPPASAARAAATSRAISASMNRSPCCSASGAPNAFRCCR